MQTKMTLKELAAMDAATVTPRIAAQVLGCNAYALNVSAKEGKLAIEHFFSGNRLHISRADLLRFCGWGVTA